MYSESTKTKLEAAAAVAAALLLAAAPPAALAAVQHHLVSQPGSRVKRQLKRHVDLGQQPE
jgi:hypothetical protein